MINNLNEIRASLQRAIISFVEENQGNTKILLIRWPPGIGKTVSGSKALFSRDDILTVWLGPTHQQLMDSVTEHNTVFHLKGRNQLCQNPLLKIFEAYNIDVRRVLCYHCERFRRQTCVYYAQFNNLRSAPQSFVTVHHHLNQNFVSNYLKSNRSYHYRCLVIDEYPLGNLNKNISFEKEDLKETWVVVGKCSEELVYKDDQWTNAPAVAISTIILALDKVLRDTRGEGIFGLSFIKSFINSIKEQEILSLDDIENILRTKEMSFFMKSYKEKLYHSFTQGTRIKNILYDALFITKKCLLYNQILKVSNESHRILPDINLPFYSLLEETRINERTYHRKCIWCTRVAKKLPDVPVIIMDATGDAKLYNELFEKEVVELKLEINIERNIYQISDGLYNIASLSNWATKERVFSAVLSVIRNHLEQGEPRIAIVTIKKYLEPLRIYLIQHEIEENQIYFNHYGNIRGLNIMEEDKTLILVGTPEPNMVSFPKQVGCWYEGKNIISAKRVKEREVSDFYGHDYKYQDPRYSAHIRSIREHEIEQTIERLRFILYHDKTAYLFSMLPIDFETRKTMINDLLRDIDPVAKLREKLFKLKHDRVYLILKPLAEAELKWDRLYHKLKRKIPFRRNIKLLKLTVRSLLQVGCVEKVAGVMRITQKGKWYLNELEDKIADLEREI